MKDDRLAARHAHTQRKDTVWPNVLNLRKMDAIFIAKGKIAEQVFQGVNAALCEQLRALRAHTFNHSNVGLQAFGHRGFTFTRDREAVDH